MAMAQRGTEGRVTDEDQEFLLEQLAKSREALLESFAGVSEAQGRFRPERDRWSILECVEHLTLADKGLLSLIRNAETGTADPSSEREMMLFGLVKDRTNKNAAPEPSKPKGRYASLREASEKLIEGRKEVAEYVKASAANLRDHWLTHPTPSIGRIDAYTCCLIIAAHGLRHAEQIREVRADANFPRK